MWMLKNYMIIGCLVFSGVALATLDTEHYVENPYKITATNTLESESNRYSENNLKDLDIKTAWCSPNNGNGATLSFITTDKKPLKAKTLQFFILPGYTKSASLFAANERPKDITVNVSRRDGSSLATTKISLKDEMIWQRFWSYWDAEYPIQDLKITFSIDSYYPGNKYTDLCISELSIVPVIDYSMSDWEEAKLNSLEVPIMKGDVRALNELMRLFVIFDYQDRFYDLMDKAFIYQTRNFFILLDVQMPNIQSYILGEALEPGGKTYGSKYYSNTDVLNIALQLKKSGMQSSSLDKFISNTQELIKLYPNE